MADLRELGLESESEEEEGGADDGQTPQQPEGVSEPGADAVVQPEQGEHHNADQGSVPGLSLKVPSMDAVGGGAPAKLLRTSNVVALQPAEFDKARFHPEPSFHSKAVIRWRSNPITGQPESNAKVIRWSDGSSHLMVGNELLSLDELDTSHDHSFLTVRRPPAPGEKASVLQGQGRIMSKLAFTPSLHSKLHKRHTSAVAQRHQKRGHVQQRVVPVDPEMEQQRKAAEEAEKLKSARKRREEIAKHAAVSAASSEGRLGIDALEAGADEDAEEEDFVDGTKGGQELQQEQLLQHTRGEFDESRLENVKKRGRTQEGESIAPDDTPAPKHRILDDDDDDDDDEEEEGEGRGDDEQEREDGKGNVEQEMDHVESEDTGDANAHHEHEGDGSTDDSDNGE